LTAVKGSVQQKCSQIIGSGIDKRSRQGIGELSANHRADFAATEQRRKKQGDKGLKSESGSGTNKKTQGHPAGQTFRAGLETDEPVIKVSAGSLQGLNSHSTICYIWILWVINQYNVNSQEANMPYTPIEEQWIRENLKNSTFGNQIITQDAVDSTNDLAKQRILQGPSEGLVILADFQSQGKGRLGRQWFSEPGTGIYLSAVLPAPEQPELASPLTLVAGLAGASAINEFSAVKAELKWPNDILLNGKKVSGILCEFVQTENQSGIVVGIGINCNHTAFPKELESIATSILHESGTPVERPQLIVETLRCLEREYRTYLDEGLEKIVSRWMEHSEMFERRVSVTRGGTVFSGTALRLDASGRLVVLTDKGEERTFDSGEVTLKN